MAPAVFPGGDFRAAAGQARGPDECHDRFRGELDGCDGAAFNAARDGGNGAGGQLRHRAFGPRDKGP
eukprot:11164878-Lingulodinium_polyedra.AAC.1